MEKVYLGLDVGTVSTKGVIIDSSNNIIVSEYLYNNRDLVKTVKELLSILNKKLNHNKYRVVSVGTTGFSRKLIGMLVEANVVRNEIIAHAVGCVSMKSDVRTIFEIGGQDFKIILLEDGKVVDYNISTLYEGDVIRDYFYNVIKDKKIDSPIVFQGGMSKNVRVIKEFEELIGDRIFVDDNSHLLGAIGVGILAKESGIEREFNFNIDKIHKNMKVLEG